jgi:hypothetical protein
VGARGREVIDDYGAMRVARRAGFRSAGDGSALAPAAAPARDHAAASLAAKRRVHLGHALEDLLGRLLGLLARRMLDDVEIDRLAELDGDLRDPQALELAKALRAVDRDRHDGHARLDREPAESGLGLAELPPWLRMKSRNGGRKSCDFAMKRISLRSRTATRKWSMKLKWLGARIAAPRAGTFARSIAR